MRVGGESLLSGDLFLFLSTLALSPLSQPTVDGFRRLSHNRSHSISGLRVTAKVRIPATQLLIENLMLPLCFNDDLLIRWWRPSRPGPVSSNRLGTASWTKIAFKLRDLVFDVCLGGWLIVRELLRNITHIRLSMTRDSLVISLLLLLPSLRLSFLNLILLPLRVHWRPNRSRLSNWCTGGEHLVIGTWLRLV